MKSKEKANRKSGSVLTYIFIALLTVAKSVGLSSDSKIYWVIFLLGLILGLSKVFNEHFSRREVVLVLPMVAIGALNFVVGRETTLLFTALVLLTLKNTNIRNLIKMMLWIKIIFFIGSLLLVWAGYLEDNTFTMWRDGAGVLRHSFIYGHPNAAHLNLAIILIVWTYIYYEKVNIFSVLACGLIDYFFYYYTLSRTGLLVSLLCLALVWLFKKVKIIRKVVQKNVKWIFIEATIITFVISLLYGKLAIISQFDSLLTGRIYYNNYFLTNITMPLIGKSDYGNLLIDNGYISLLFNGGLLAYAWFALMNMRTGQHLKEINYEKEALLITAFCIYSLTESFYANAIMNVSLMFFALYIFNNRKRIKDMETI